jgi:hypothetical protein
MMGTVLIVDPRTHPMFSRWLNTYHTDTSETS